MRRDVHVRMLGSQSLRRDPFFGLGTLGQLVCRLDHGSPWLALKHARQAKN